MDAACLEGSGFFAGAAGLATFFLTMIPLRTRLPSGFLEDGLGGFGAAGLDAEGVREGGGFAAALFLAATALTQGQ